MNPTLKALLIFGLVLFVLVTLVYFYTSSGQQPPKVPNNGTAYVNGALPPATNESPQLVTTLWTASAIAGEPVLAGTSITLQFDEAGRVTGFDGCNIFSTGYSVDGTNLTLDQTMITTEITCAEDIMAQANVFTSTLLATTTFDLGDGVLVLSQNGVAGLTFFGQTNSLSKTAWNVTGYNNGEQAVVSPIINTELTLTFGDDGVVSGSSGCNTFSGPYTNSNQTISIGPLATTLMACVEPEGISEQEADYVTALQNSTTWQIQGNVLHLRTADDELAITGVNSFSN